MATTAQVHEEQRLAPAEAGQLVTTWRRFRKHRLGLLGLIMLTLLVLSVIIVPMISPFTYASPNEAAPFQPAGAHALLTGHTYYLGTDSIGRDNLTRLFFGGRISLAVGLLTTLLVV